VRVERLEQRRLLSLGRFDISPGLADLAADLDQWSFSAAFRGAAAAAPTVSVDRLITTDQTPQLTGTVDDVAATIEVTVSGTTYPALNHGDGTWTVADGTVAPALAYGLYDVAVAATGAGGTGYDETVDELEVYRTIYYVNNGSTTNDVWCTAAGHVLNTGLTPGSPLNDVTEVIRKHDLEPGDLVLIDTGTYSLVSDQSVMTGDGGDAAAPVTFKASPYGVTMNRGSTSSGQYAWEIYADYVILTTAQSTAYPGTAQSWMEITGGYGGVLVTGQHVSLSRLDVNANFQYGVHVSGDYLTIENSLLRGTSASSASGIYGDSTDFLAVQNNTVYGNGQYGAYFDTCTNSLLRNSIVAADGAGDYAVYVSGASGANLPDSDYNLIYAIGGSHAGFWGGTRSALPEWRGATGQDTHSLARDPLFVDAAADDFHLRSTFGTYNGTTWTTYAVDSPAIDTGYGDPGAEPSPNTTPLHGPNLGARNLGAYGGTEQASKTPAGRQVWLLEPIGGEAYDTSPQSIRWTWAGQGWQSGDTLELEYSANSGGAYAAIPAASAEAVEGGTFSWDISGLPSSPLYRVRATSNQDGTVSDASGSDFQIAVNGPVAFYVNDSSTTNDAWCTAPGDDANNGLSSGAPKATVQAVLDTYNLQPGHVVRIDTGTYNLAADVVVDGQDGGDDVAPVTFEASPYGVTIDRNSSVSGNYVWEILADYVTMTTAVSTAHPGVAESWMLVTDGHGGIDVVGQHVTLARLHLAYNEEYSIRADGNSSTQEGHCLTIENCLIRNTIRDHVNAYGVYANYVEDLTIRNSTFYGDYGHLVSLRYSTNAVLENSIIWADVIGSSIAYGVYTYPSNSQFVPDSDFNLLYATGGAYVGYKGGFRSTLAKWRAATGQDANSTSRDPLFIGGTDYHLKSTAGSYHGGVWTADAADSPGIDVGHGDAGAEPSPNATPLHAADLGARNLGAYGGTEQASKTPAGRGVRLLEPLGDEVYDASPATIRWTWVGLAWQAGNTLNLEYSADSGGSYSAISGAAAEPVTAGTFSWDISGYPSSPLYRVKTTSNQDAASSDASPNDFQIRVNGPIVYYVNNASTSYDAWCTAVGDDANDGVSPGAPTATVQAVLDRYDLEPGDTVRIDTGAYTLAANIRIGWEDNGAYGNRLTFEGSPYGVTVDHDLTWGIPWHIDAASVRLTTATSSKHPDQPQRWMEIVGGGTGVRIDASSILVDRLNIHNARSYGIYINDSSARVENCLVWGTTDSGSTGISARESATIENTTVFGNGKYGIVVDSSDQLKNNIVWADGVGDYAVYVSGFSSPPSSDYNLLYATDGASVGYYSGARTTLANWQAATGRDANSIEADPLFVDTASADFHLESTYGHFRQATGDWAFDAVTSPAIDSADPAGSYSSEPEPNGDRLNLGAYGNTSEASKSGPWVADRRVFYDNSYWDGNTPGPSGAADDPAIAPDPSEISDETGTHDGGNDVAVLTDSTRKWGTNFLVGLTVENLTDGSSGTITANTQTTITATLGGGTENDWDDGDTYSFPIGLYLGKTALLPGQTAMFNNYTSYSGGITGIVIDIGRLVTPGAIDASDFIFTFGNDDTPGDWLDADPPSGVTVREGEGVGGSDRITITWNRLDTVPPPTSNKSIPNRNWLRVEVLANADTGLAASDAFYFGNNPGENTRDFLVNYDDVFDVVWPKLFTTALVEGAADVNGDRLVNYDDLFNANCVWPNLFASPPLASITTPAAPAPPPATVDSVLSDDTSWVTELIWWDEPDGSFSESHEDDDEEQDAVDGVFAVYAEE